MIAHDNEPTDSKQGQEERKALMECLTRAYGVTPEDDEGYCFHYAKLTQKEIASQLGYDNSTLGKMLKPDWIKARNHSYKPLIACLKKQIEINQLKEEGKKSRIPGWAAIAVMSLLLFLNGLWLLSSPKVSEPETNTEKHIVETEGAFAALFSGEGGRAVAKRVAEDAYDLLKDLRDSIKAGRMPSNAQKKEAVFRFQNLARQIDGEVRNQMRSLNYIAVFKEINVVDIKDHITPRDSLFKCPPEAILLDSCPACATHSNAHFDRLFWRLKDFLFEDHSREDFIKVIGQAIRATQQELSTEDMKVFSHFKKTGELIKPVYGN